MKRIDSETSSNLLELRLDGKVVLFGDNASIGVIFNNLTGRNFKDKSHEDYVRYVQHIEQHLDVSFIGKLLAYGPASNSAQQIDAYRFANNLLPTSREKRTISNEL